MIDTDAEQALEAWRAALRRSLATIDEHDFNGHQGDGVALPAPSINVEPEPYEWTSDDSMGSRLA